MNCRVATRGPARAVSDVARVIHVADVEGGRNIGTSRLRVAAEAQVAVTNRQELGIDRAVRIVAGGASLAQCGVLEDKGPRLLAMALGAGLVQTSHRQAASRLHDIHPVRIMAGDAIHFPLGDGVMLRQMELGVDIEMAFVACFRIFPRIDNELLPPCPTAATDRDVLARGTVARFAAVLAGHLAAFETEARMSARGKCACDIAVTVRADLVAHEGRAFDRGSRNDGSVHRRTGGNQQDQPNQDGAKRKRCQTA